MSSPEFLAESLTWRDIDLCYFLNVIFLPVIFSGFVLFPICELFEILIFVTLNLSSLSSQPIISLEFSRVPPLWIIGSKCLNAHAIEWGL